MHFGLAAAAAMLLTLAPASAQAPPAADPIAGLWSAAIAYPDPLRGQLDIRRDKAGWHASIGGAEAHAASSASEIRLTFAGGRGGFRGRLLSGGRLAGFWLQPASGNGDKADPGGFGQPFATPVALARLGPGHWRGDVVPLRASFTLYLKIFPRPDGVLVAAFRNPEMNSNGGAQQFRVERTGDSLRFSARYPSGEVAVSHDAMLLHDPDRIRIAWRDLGRTIELSRTDPARAAHFFPRLPGEPPYAYRPPRATGDGWTVARGRDVGIDEAALTKAVQRIAGSDPAARPASLIHSLLLARHGRLVLEEYFFGYDGATPHDLRSAGKTFASVMLGAEMRRGAAIGPDSRVYPLLRAMGPFANPDPRKARITLAHLMTHSAGLACNDNDDSSPGNEGTMQAQKAQPDWWKYTLDLPAAFEPGTRYAYCSGNMNLVGAALTTSSRQWLPALFERDVAAPLQFGHWYWNLMPNGEGYLGGGAHLLPRDLLKIGQLYLDGGRWRGRRIFSRAWIADSTAPRIAVSPATTGLSPAEFGDYYGEGADGLAWHRVTITAGGRRYEGYQAGGNGGQLLMVFPELDLIAVLTGGNYRQGGIWSRWPQQIVGDQIVPAIRR